MTKSTDFLCLEYGAPVMLIGLSTSVVYTLTTEANIFLELLSFYILISTVSALGIFGLRSRLYGKETTFHPLEISIALLSGAGLALPVTVMGVFIAGISTGDYIGVEERLKATKDPEAEIQRLVRELDLSKETQTGSMELLEILKDKDLMRGRSMASMIGAVIYISARENNEPRTLDDIAVLTSASKKEIGRAYRYIARNTDIRVIPPQPSDYVERFADQLELGENVKDKASELVEFAREKEFTSGKSPRGVAGGAIYLAAHMEGEKRTMKDIADTIGITTVTIRERSKEFVRKLDLEDYPEHLGPKPEEN